MFSRPDPTLDRMRSSKFVAQLPPMTAREREECPSDAGGIEPDIHHARRQWPA